MNCQTAESLLHAYFDDELDLLSSLDIERHLEACATCSARLTRERALRARIAASLPGFPTPPHLRESIALALDRLAPPSKPTTRWWSVRARRLVPLAAAVMLLVSAIVVTSRPSAELLLARQIRDGHVRSLMAAHLADVTSSDRHTVKPWFAGKLSFSPWVGDLSDEGFPLVGGRLEYLNDRPVAAIVYKRREHIINLFIWPADGARPDSARLLREKGYQVVHWADSGMAYWAISDLNSDELTEFTRLVESRATQSTSAAASDPVPSP
jgi:anti-sigma factor RsiW